MRKKALSPAHRRVLAQEAVAAGLCSRRAACRFLRLARSTYGYRGRAPQPQQERLGQRLMELSAKYPRYGPRRMAVLLRREGWIVGKRQIQRLRRQAGLRVPPTRWKVPRRGVSTGWPTRATHRNHVWTWDFIADATVRGGALPILTILDEHTRECHVLWADRALKAADVLNWLQKAIAEHGAPEYLRSDNGPEFIAKLVQHWLAGQPDPDPYIKPGSPWQNGFVESFHGRFRDECLNREQLWTLTEARVVVGDYRQEYNQFRPHSRIGYETPASFAARTCPSPSPVGMDKPPRTPQHESSRQTNTPVAQKSGPSHSSWVRRIS
ncbi:MAG TPA: IS3 family transposase [Verrucomicrobiae bacterium]|nr:IS3 family transposase [Verrucomicrobiae bacterium]